jgi:SAM-dependent methyltransferase
MSKKSESGFFDKSYASGSRASAVGQVYSLIGGRLEAYQALIFRDIQGKRVLEYGCGTGSHSLEMARRGARVTGIDISEVGVTQASAAAESSGISGADYLVMDAENMLFPDRTFDMVTGEGILHHLDLERAYQGISRVLKPGGVAVFMEPLAGNPAIALFRYLTPSLRTPDEHPLRMKDLRLAGRYFHKVQFHYFHLCSFAAMLLLKTRLFYPAVRALDRVDSVLFRVVPPLRPMAWYAIMLMEDPRD